MVRDLVTNVTPEAKSLRKLPMWGEQVGPGVVNFEWPTPDMLKVLPNDVSMASITLKTYTEGHDNISSVSCSLSNGLKSPVFEVQDGRPHYRPKTLLLNQRVRAVQAHSISEGPRVNAYRLTFLDDQRQELGSYNPNF